MDPYSPEIIRILRDAKTIAVVGLSDNPSRPSYGVSEYMLRQGYRIIPVNPNVKSVFGQRAYAAIAEIPKEIRVDVVDVFRRSEVVPELVDQAIARQVKLIWMQLGVVHQAAAEKAGKTGIPVVMDACLAVVHRHLAASSRLA